MRMARAVAAASLAPFVLADGFRNVVYFPEWSVETNFTLASLDWSVISHINYAYAVPRADGSLHFEDETAAFKMPYDGVDGDLRGSFGLANKLKREHRHVKVGISIGSSNVFSEIAASSDARDAFVKNAVALMLDLGLDFVNIDWQFPATPDEIDHCIQLLNDLRAKLNELAFKAELTIASVGYHDDSWAGKLASICSVVDAVNVMAYDYAGAWSAVSGFQSNLYADERTTSSVADIVQFYLDHDCPSKKLVVGIPAYSRKFQDTEGLYKPFDKERTERDGFSPYKDLPIDLEQFDATTKSAYSYDAGTKTLQTYDNPQSVAEKVEFVQSHNLAGTMFWHAQQDAQADDRSLIHAAFQAMGKAIDLSLNNLNYPTSTYDNVRRGSYGDAYGCRDYTVVKGDDVNKIVQAQCYQRGGYCHPDGFPLVVSKESGEKCPYWIEIDQVVQVCCAPPPPSSKSAMSSSSTLKSLRSPSKRQEDNKDALDLNRWTLHADTKLVQRQDSADCLLAPAPDVPVKIATCNAANKLQTWAYDASTLQLRHSYWSGYCLDQRGRLSTCGQADKLQRFTLDVVANES
ncbi:unnamed protein product [Aphanomyces euteiches]